MTKEEIKQYLINRISIDPQTNCWNWLLNKNNDGYGCCRITYFKNKYRKLWRVHRLSYIVFKEDFREFLCVCHHCDNPSCINPDHLFLGTDKNNCDDKMKKGRHKVVPRWGNNYAGKQIMAEFKLFKSYCEAGRELGVSDNAIRKRIKLNWPGYMLITKL